MLAHASWDVSLREWLIAAGTVGAVVVALWITLRQEYLARRRRPSLSLGSPGIAAEEVSRADATGLPVVTGRAVYLRLAVTNAIGKDAAADVEVLLSQIRRPSLDSDTDMVDVSFPGFGWTHAGTTRLTVPPGVTRHIDLGRVRDDRADRFELLVIPHPVDLRNQLLPGTYELVLTLSARNADAHHYVMRFSFEPDRGDPVQAIEVIDPPHRFDEWRVLPD